MLKTVGFPSIRTGDQAIINGNLVIGTAGKGVDFSADPNAPGMTSELLDDYEEKVAEIEILMAGDYLRRDDFQHTVEALFKK